MISSVRGTLLYSTPEYVVVECGGLGFKCYITSSSLGKLPKVGGEVFLYTHLVVKEDALDLYGFSSQEEMDAFKLITSVSGVGPKLGIAVLSQFSPDRLLMHIAAEDAKALTAASGVGIKLAQRIVLELKDKVAKLGGSISTDVLSVGNANTFSNSKEAVAALVSLGFSQSEASLAVGRLDQSLPSDELIKLALKQLSRQV